jgi:hypothetical protein
MSHWCVTLMPILIKPNNFIHAAGPYYPLSVGAKMPVTENPLKVGVFSHKKQCNCGLIRAGLVCVCVLLFANRHCLNMAKHHCLGWLASYVDVSLNYTAEHNYFLRFRQHCFCSCFPHLQQWVGAVITVLSTCHYAWQWNMISVTT